MNTIKKLQKNHNDKMIAGVLSGFADYFELDPTVIRVAFVLILFITGFFPGLIAYIIAYFIIPDGPRMHETEMPFLKKDMETTPPVETKTEMKTETEDIM